MKKNNLLILILSISLFACGNPSTETSTTETPIDHPYSLVHTISSATIANWKDASDKSQMEVCEAALYSLKYDNESLRHLDEAILKDYINKSIVNFQLESKDSLFPVIRSCYSTLVTTNVFQGK